MKEAKKTRAAEFAEFGRSFKFDRRLFAADVRVSVAYCDALFHAGVVTRAEAERVKNGLQTLLKRADFYTDYFEEPHAADVHSFIETRLIQLIGETGAKINVGRSRAEQSITAFRLWLRGEIETISECARALQKALVGSGERQKTAIFPIRTGSRTTQPILWAHWCLAYFERLARDRERLEEVWRRVNVLPLGAADATGTAFEIDREAVAVALGFEGVSANSLDAATDADFAAETVGALTLLMIHLGRLAEELLLYSAPEFSFVRLARDFSSASSALNDDVRWLEILRDKAAEIFGHQTAILTRMKSAPPDIDRSAREIEKSIFEAVDTGKNCLMLSVLIVESSRVDEAKTLAYVSDKRRGTDELIDYLIQRNVPVGAARESVEKIAAYAETQNKKPAELRLQEFQQFSANIGEDIFRALSLEQSLANKNQIGGTAPERVFEALEQARENLEREGQSSEK